MMRWFLSSFLLIFAVLMPLLVEEWTGRITAMIALIEFMCVMVLLGFWLPPRLGQWAFRGFAGAVFFCYAAYFIHEWFLTDKPFQIAERRSAASPRNALLGLSIIGLPGLWYAVMGRLTLRREREIDETPNSDAQFGEYETELNVALRLSNAEFGTEAERERILDLKHRLERKLEANGLGQIDGEEFGGGECSLFVQTNEPAEAERAVQEFFAVESPTMSYSVTKSNLRHNG